eukprot:214717_1
MMTTENYKLFGIIFDLFGALISLIDLVTDVIILITWYNENKMTFFWISFSILIMAQLTYLLTFHCMHAARHNIPYAILSFIFTIPFAPCLAFIFYFVSDEDSYLRQFIDNKSVICFNFDWHKNEINVDANRKQQYLENIFYKHIGFILEAVVEAFPQSILQLTVIVYYNEPNILSIISILISMTSVCSKVFLYVTSSYKGNFVGWKLKLFSWLSFVIDFFGVFFLISFSFYNPKNEHFQSFFIHIGNIILWLSSIGILPIVIVTCLGLYIFYTINIFVNNWNNNLHISQSICLCICYFIGMTLLLFIGLLLIGLLLFY